MQAVGELARAYAGLEVAHGGAQVVVEVIAYLPGGEDADDEGEHRQDQERERGRGDSEPPADRQPGEAAEQGREEARVAHAARSTYPAPRMVWRTRGSPPSSSLRRRFEMN